MAKAIGFKTSYNEMILKTVVKYFLKECVEIPKASQIGGKNICYLSEGCNSGKRYDQSYSSLLGR